MKAFLTIFSVAALSASQAVMAKNSQHDDQQLLFPKASTSAAWYLQGADQTKEPIQVAGTCFSSGESTSGMNKICYYNCVGGSAAITIKSTQLCPLTIRD